MKIDLELLQKAYIGYHTENSWSKGENYADMSRKLGFHSNTIRKYENFKPTDEELQEVKKMVESLTNTFLEKIEVDLDSISDDDVAKAYQAGAISEFDLSFLQTVNNYFKKSDKQITTEKIIFEKIKNHKRFANIKELAKSN